MSTVGITPSKVFLDYELQCPLAVLQPRFETETMVARLIEALRADHPTKALRIADFGTGSGAIAIALASALPTASIDAYELSESASVIAQNNFNNFKLENINLIKTSWQNATANYDLIISNPPYLTTASTLQLLGNQQLTDPYEALDGGINGLQAIHDVIHTASNVLSPNGSICLEHGLGQHYDVVAKLIATNFKITEWGRDIQGLKRFIIAKLS